MAKRLTYLSGALLLRLATLEEGLMTEEAIGRFVELLGADAVLTEPDDLVDFRDPFWIPGDDTYAPSAVVMPSSVEEVQAVVRIANELGVPLWTTSQGRNNGYGGPSPRRRRVGRREPPSA